MSVTTDAISDFSLIASELGSESVTFTRTGPNTTTTLGTTIVFRTERNFGEPAVAGYCINQLTCRFLVSALSPEPKQGDLVTRGTTDYEVVKVEKLVRDTQWKLTCERAFANSDNTVSIALKRFTLGVDVAGAVTETASTVGTYSAIIMQEDDVADMINRLGVKGDKQSTTFFVAQSVSVLPMDFITYNSRDYRITMIGDEGRVARLKRIRVELYA